MLNQDEEKFMHARITIFLNKNVLDPQAKAIHTALHNLHFTDVLTLRQGKVFDLSLDETNKEEALKKLTLMCEQLLANTVVEEYNIEIL